MIGTQMLHHLLLEFAFVKTRIGETHRERDEVIDVIAFHQRGKY